MATISTSLLKIVAEAASAYRTGSDVYVVAQVEHPHEREVFYTYDGTTDPRADAEAFLGSRDDRQSWELFGPYVTEQEAPASTRTALDYKVTVETTSHAEESFQLVREGEVDALFLTLPAIDKFVVPYYTSVLGAERALEIRHEYVKKPLPMGHVWNSKFIPMKED